MKACALHFFLAWTFFSGQTKALAQLKVEPDEKNVVASRLEGKWIVMPALTKRLGGNIDQRISFKSDPSVVNVVPERLIPYLQKCRIYMAGYMMFLGKNLSPFFLITNQGNPTIVYLREKGDDPYGDAESFLVTLVPAVDPVNDLLFVGHESIPRPFSAYERDKTKAPPDDAGRADEKADKVLLQGKWKVTKMVKRGVVMAPERFARMSFEFSKDKMILGGRGDSEQRSFSFKIDSTKKPKQIDCTAESGPFKGETIPGIYQLDADSLVMCLPHDNNKDQPDAFEALGGAAPSRILFTLQRVKD